jgi:hypothetical protein
LNAEAVEIYCGIRLTVLRSYGCGVTFFFFCWIVRISTGLHNRSVGEWLWRHFKKDIKTHYVQKLKTHLKMNNPEDFDAL